MITSSQEYQEFLAGIAPSFMEYTRIPTYEPIYEIDLNTRKVSAPPFIGVEGDHEAEYIFFRVDRYFDSIDLSNAIGLISFKNAKGEEFFQLIPCYDIYSEQGKMIFPWVIQAPAVQYAGTVLFSIKFYKANSTSGEIEYELNTQVAKTKSLAGWTSVTNKPHQYRLFDPSSLITTESQIENLNRLLSLQNELKVYWKEK